MLCLSAFPQAPCYPFAGSGSGRAPVPCEQVQEVVEWGFTCLSRTAGPW